MGMERAAQVDRHVSERLSHNAAWDREQTAWGVTPERVTEAVRHIVETANPLRIVVFGSWARGEAGPKSDLDLAVTLDGVSTVRWAGDIYVALSGKVKMSMDILTFSPEYHDKMKASINSVHGDIERQGIVLYERDADGSASRSHAA